MWNRKNATNLFGRTRGFTLVELLVVITILGMLIALLLPAVNAAREAGRKANCVNNMKQIATGLIHFESNKGRFPGRSYQPLGRGPLAHWTISLLPYIEQSDAQEAFLNFLQNPSDSQLQNQFTQLEQLYLDVLVCPSDADAVTRKDMAPISYAANGGRPDAQNVPLDHKENGVFHYHHISTQNEPKVTLAYVSQNDGASNTILIGEKLAANVPRVLSPSDVSSWLPRYKPQYIDSELRNALVWFRITSDEAPNDTQVTMKTFQPGLIESENSDLVMMQPSSNHPGGFHIAFAGGNVRFLSDEMKYTLYARLMTPDGAKAKEPGSANVLTRDYRTPSYRWVDDLISEGDLE
jgi:prepilin-type N-terminal cleavage/methylation domain-containing protein